MCLYSIMVSFCRVCYSVTSGIPCAINFQLLSTKIKLHVLRRLELHGSIPKSPSDFLYSAGFCICLFLIKKWFLVTKIDDSLHDELRATLHISEGL